MNRLEIVKVKGREILDSRGTPTIEAEVTLKDGSMGIGIAPSGASTGSFEALELRDQEQRYFGKGVLKAVSTINDKIEPLLIGIDASDLYLVDHIMIQADGTCDKSNFGANAILAVSIACAKAAATSLQIPLYRFFGGVNATTMPVPMMNILNGGVHASNDLDIQEFMIVPVGASNFQEALRWCAEVYHTLGTQLKKAGLSTNVGDEGGYAPQIKNEEEALTFIMNAIKEAGYQPYKDFMIAIDAASSEWKGTQCGEYILPKSKTHYTSQSLIKHWNELVEKYPIFSIEDALDEEDWEGWNQLTKVLGNKIQLVGDDLFVTNPKRLQRGIDYQCGNAILIKPNQIGTLSETIEAVKKAQRQGYRTVMSHRSGESEDTTIADLSVGLNCGQIKTGAPSRSERVAKYNRLLRIEEAIQSSVYYEGKDIVK